MDGHEVLVVQEDGLIVMLDFFFAFGAPNIFGNISPVPVAMIFEALEHEQLFLGSPLRFQEWEVEFIDHMVTILK